MVFSFFGKKDQPPKPAAKPEARPAPKPAAPPAAAPKPAAPKPAAKPAAAPVPPADEQSLDFTATVADEARAEALAENIELHESSERVHPAIEEAAILFANGHDEEALQALEAAVRRDDLGSAAEQAWFMLFDLFHALGRREAFDARALDYVVRFEKSPPAWPGSEEAQAGPAAIPLAILGPNLDAGSARQIETLQRLVSKNSSVRVDLGRMRGVEAPGCELLLNVLRQARRERHELIMQNAAHLSRLLEARVQPGTRENEPIWLLLLELYQSQGLQEPYEEWALNYAITFEVSPPAWEPKRAGPKPAKASLGQPKTVRDVFELRGELSGSCAQMLQDLHAYASTRESILIDLGQLQRMDFVCAGNLLNKLFGLAGTGKPMKLVNASALVAALLSVIGVGQVASVERRRY